MRTVKEIKEDIAKSIQHMDDRRAMDMYRAEITSGIQIDRLEKICNAEHEGRCVTLPYNVGDKIYVVTLFCNSFFEDTVSEIIFDKWGCEIKASKGRVFEDNELNIKFFLTREDAEKALKEREQSEKI